MFLYSMPTVDIWGVLHGVKCVAAYVWDSKILRLGLISSFVVGAATTFLTFWQGLTLPTINLSSLGVPTEYNDTLSIMQLFLYMVHADYCVSIINCIISIVNAVVPFVVASILAGLVFKFALMIRESIGSDIRNAT